MRSGREHQSTPLHEGLISPEAPRLILTKHLLIAGEPYTGKTTVSSLLGAALNAKVENGKGRINRRVGSASDKDVVNLAHQHSDFDGFTKHSLRYNPELRIWEARLAAINAAEAADEIDEENIRIALLRQNGDLTQDFIPQPPVFSVLLTATDEAKFDRALEEAQNKAVKDGTPVPTDDEIRASIEARAVQDTRDWAPIHPNYITPGISPFKEELRRPNGMPVYHYRLDNSDLDQLETARHILSILPPFGAAIRLAEAPSMELGLTQERI